MTEGDRPAIRFRVPEGRDVVFVDAVRGEVRFQATSSAIRSSSAPTVIPPTTSPWLWMMR